MPNIPKTGLKDYIIPIFKGGDSNNAKYYRGIALDHIIANVYSPVLLNRLREWTEKYETISDCQFGYQKCKSATDCMFILHYTIIDFNQVDIRIYQSEKVNITFEG